MMDRLLASCVVVMFQKTALPFFDLVPSLCLPARDLKAPCEQQGIKSLAAAATDKWLLFITGENKAQGGQMTCLPPRSAVVQETWILVLWGFLQVGILKFGDSPVFFHLRFYFFFLFS